MDMQETSLSQKVWPKKLHQKLLRSWRGRKKRKEKDKKNKERQSEELLSELQKHVFKIKVKAGEGGKLFGSLTNSNIAEEIEKVLGKEFDKRWISLESNIKSVGLYDVVVKLPGGVSGKIKVEVVKSED